VDDDRDGCEDNELFIRGPGDKVEVELLLSNEEALLCNKELLCNGNPIGTGIGTGTGSGNDTGVDADNGIGVGTASGIVFMF